ncbi:MAG: TetR/AcrR family transcriptional regulator [Chloroflexota bacterium]|nr:TetR/AcrR family transcriptional regulator [Chloroflexota bacterium]
MPYPAQVNAETILDRTRTLIADEGSDGLSLARLAEALGITAPSLYRYYKSKTELLRAVHLTTQQQLTQTMLAARQDSATPYERMLAMARAYRAYALAQPVLYRLAFADVDVSGDAEALLALALPLQSALEDYAGSADSLAHLRGLWALVHGFVSLEIGGRFQRGGSLDADFERAVTAYLRGLTS